MEQYTMFVDWKNQYSENEYSTQAIYRWEYVHVWTLSCKLSKFWGAMCRILTAVNSSVLLHTLNLSVE